MKVVIGVTSFFIALLVLISGCSGKGLSGSVYGAQLNTGFVPSVIEKKQLYDKVGVVVDDNRPQVQEGIAEPYEVGMYSRENRDYYIALKGHTPLATQMSIDLYKELHAKGFVKESDENITLDVTVNKWFFKGSKYKDLDYDLNATVYRNSRLIVSVPFVADVHIDVGFFASTLRGIGDDIPAIYRVLVKKIVQDPRILYALSDDEASFAAFYKNYESSHRTMNPNIEEVKKQRELGALDKRFENGELGEEEYLEQRYMILLP